MCGICLFMLFSGLPHVFSFIYELLINTLANLFSKIHKIIIRLEETFHRQICIHFSEHYEKGKYLDGRPSCSQCTLQTIFGFIPIIMPQGIVIVHCPPVSVMICNNSRILELDYPPIKHPSLFLLNLWHSQTQKV